MKMPSGKEMARNDDMSLELWREIGVGCNSTPTKPISEKQPCRLLQMPPEILEHVLQNVDRSTRVTLRLVCRTLKKFVDDFMGMYLIINDQRQPPEALEFFSRIVIRKAVIENAGFISFHCLFKKPELIDAIFLDGEVRAEFFTSIIKSCPKLNILILLGQIHGVIPQRICDDAAMFRKSLFHLQSVDIRIAYSSGVVALPYEDAQQACFNMMNFLQVIHAPILKTCCLDSWVTAPFDKAQVTEILLDFLEIHNKLQGLLIYFRLVEKDFPNLENEMDDPVLRQRLIPRLENLSQKLQLTTCILSSIPYSGMWEYFLRGQNSLNTLSFCDKVCPWGPCEEPLKNNWSTLQIIYILTSLQSPLDSSIFAQCRNLKELILINTSTRDILPDVAHDLHSLDKMLVCEKLRFLALSNLIIDRQDLWKLVMMKSLDTLALLSSGFGYDTGINLELLRHFLACRKFNALLIDGTVALDEQEASQIFEIIQRLVEAPEEGRSGRSNEMGTTPVGVINIRPSPFHQWTPSLEGDGFLFNMEFNHHHP